MGLKDSLPPPETKSSPRDGLFPAADLAWMDRALALARGAGERGEVPVGAVLVRRGQLLGEGANGPVGAHDPTAHAEIVALRAAAIAESNYRLPGTTLYVTIEPCAMCAGALIHARVERLVFATREPRAGAVVSTLAMLDRDAANHRVRWEEGPRGVEAADMMKTFFRLRRGQSDDAGTVE